MDGDGVRIWFCSSVCMKMSRTDVTRRTAFLYTDV